jgi:integrase
LRRSEKRTRLVESARYAGETKNGDVRRLVGDQVRPQKRVSRETVLIAEGLDVVFVSRQLDHASVKTTLDAYAHLFDRKFRVAERARRSRSAMESWWK